MACLEYNCACGYWDMSNRIYESCPDCGAKMSPHYDEDHDPPYDVADEITAREEYENND